MGILTSHRRPRSGAMPALLPQRLGGHTPPGRDRLDRGPLAVVVVAVIDDQPNRLGPGRFVVLRRHEAPVFPEKEGEHQTWCDSLHRRSSSSGVRTRGAHAAAPALLAARSLGSSERNRMLVGPGGAPCWAATWLRIARNICSRVRPSAFVVPISVGTLISPLGADHRKVRM